MTDLTAAIDRLRYLVAQPTIKTVTTRGGVVKDKTKKQIEIETAVATEAVRFAFDHCDITGGFLAPGGLHLALLGKACSCGGVNYPSCICGLTMQQYRITHPTRDLL